jgi:hypothetical protein
MTDGGYTKQEAWSLQQQALVERFRQLPAQKRAAGAPFVKLAMEDRDALLSALDAQTARAEEAERRLGEALVMTGCKDETDLIDMANVGQSLMERIGQLTKTGGPWKGWAPADDPGEIVFDMVNHYEDEDEAAALIAKLAEAREVIAYAVEFNSGDTLQIGALAQLAEIRRRAAAFLATTQPDPEECGKVRADGEGGR